MITAGIDLASQAAHTAGCSIVWSDGRAMLQELVVGVDDGAILETLGKVDKVGIDVPLGWPVAFAEAVAEHSRDGSWPSEYVHSDSRRFRLRGTDRWIWEHLSMPQPLSVSADRIALPAMRAASLLSGLGTRVALDGSGVVVEVYPAAALRRWDLPSRGYKRKDGQGVRHELVSRFFATTDDWLTVGDTAVGLCEESDDAFDAVIAAMVARAAAVGLTETIPDDLSSAALREGWIAVPLSDSLRLLAATHGCIRREMA